MSSTGVSVGSARRVGTRPRVGRRAASLTALVITAAIGACSDAVGPDLAVSLEASVSTEMTAGDFQQLRVTVSEGSPVASWTTSDDRIATVDAGRVEALRPGTVTITATVDGAASADLVLTVVPRPGGYTADEIDYFTEIAFGSEFGGATPLLRRWPRSPTIRINGSPSPGDRQVVDSVLAEINRIVPGLDVRLVATNPTVEMHFVPQSQFQTILSEAVPGNNGLVWLWWGDEQDLVRSVVLISTTSVESLRAHIIREELTQMLGLLQDSFRYRQSIFYQGVSGVTEYLPIDRAVIELLYRSELSVGSTATQAARVARTLTRVTPGAGAVVAESGSAPPTHARPGAPGSGGSTHGPGGSAHDPHGRSQPLAGGRTLRWPSARSSGWFR